MDSESQKDELRREIQQIKDSLPSHSVPPAMLIRLEELELQLEELEEPPGEGGDA
jgi:hypothetical protein